MPLYGKRVLEMENCREERGAQKWEETQSVSED